MEKISWIDRVGNEALHKGNQDWNILILDNDQLDTHLLYFTIRLLQSSTCFEHYLPIIRRLNCIDAASGIVTLIKWTSGAQVEKELFYSSLSTCSPDGHLLGATIPDAILIQFNLLTMGV